MARKAQLNEKVLQVAQRIVRKANTTRELRNGLSVLIPKECGVGNEVAARTLGIGVATVMRVQRRIRDQVDGKKEEKGSWSGRRVRPYL